MMKAFEDTHLGLQFFSSSMSTRHETNHFNIQNDRWSYGHSHQFSGLDILSTCPYLRLIYDCNIIRWTLCVWLIYSAQQSEFWYLLQHFAGFLSVDFWAFHTSNKSRVPWELGTVTKKVYANFCHNFRWWTMERAMLQWPQTKSHRFGRRCFCDRTLSEFVFQKLWQII